MNSIDTDNYRSTIRTDLFDTAYTLWSENKDEQLYLEHSSNTYWCKVDNSKINHSSQNQKELIQGLIIQDLILMNL